MRALIGLLMSCLVLGAAHAAPGELEPGDRVAVEQAVAAACDKPVVLLGEASHGDGHGDAVKVALVERLVSECGFGGVLFEASVYEFTPVTRRAREGAPVPPDLVAAAVGAVWKFDREVQPLFDFLAARAAAGTLRLGGIDFQAGLFEQPYANGTMFAELSARLPEARRTACREFARTRLYDDDPPAGMTALERTAGLNACLREIDADVDAPDAAWRHLQVGNLLAWLSNDGQPVTALTRSRDEWMARNAVDFIDHLPAGRGKVVVWVHNAHAARNTAGLGDYGPADNLGAALSRRYGANMFCLGITARAGDYRWTPGVVKPLAEPPAGALETLGSDADGSASMLVPAAGLKSAGVCPGALFGHHYQSVRWSDAFDAVLVLDRERAPHNTRW